MCLLSTKPNGERKLKILFLHGLESKPGGSKVKHLESLGHEVLNPSLPKDSWSDSVKIASEMMLSKPDVVIGSSRGGALAMQVAHFTTNLILIAPAWEKYGVHPTVPYGTKVLHSFKDDVVPYLDSSKIIINNDGVKLIEIGDDHRMSDISALSALSDCLSEFIN